MRTSCGSVSLEGGVFTQHPCQEKRHSTYGHVVVLLKTIYEFPFHPETSLLETLPKVKAENNLNVDQLDEN